MFFVFSANSAASREKSRFEGFIHNARSGDPRRALCLLGIELVQRVLVGVLNQVGQVRLGQDLLGSQVMPFTDVVL